MNPKKELSWGLWVTLSCREDQGSIRVAECLISVSQDRMGLYTVQKGLLRGQSKKGYNRDH